MKELIKTEVFKKYRQLVITEINNFISSRLFGDEPDLKEIIGALKLARLIVRLPLKIENSEFIKHMISQDLNQFKADLTKKSLEKE